MSSALLHKEARSALRQRLEAMSGMLPAAQRAYEGFAFTPTRSKAFVEDALVGIHDSPVAIGAIQHGMSYILTLKYPSNEGTADIEGMAGALLDWFKVGTKLTYGATTVLCEKAERRGKIDHGADWAVLTVVVSILAFTTE